MARMVTRVRQLAPFLTLQHAAAAARSISPRAPGDVTVFVRAGKYRLSATGPLVLSAQDSNVTWSAYPGDAPTAVLSGAVLLPRLAWSNYSGGAPGVLVAPVSIADLRAATWEAGKRPSGGASRAGPPPLVASLFVDGVRAVRARWPNGNPSDGTGLCIGRHAMWPNEGCSSWSSCAINATAYQPAPAGVVVTGVAPNRGASPTRAAQTAATTAATFRAWREWGENGEGGGGGGRLDELLSASPRVICKRAAPWHRSSLYSTAATRSTHHRPITPCIMCPCPALVGPSTVRVFKMAKSFPPCSKHQRKRSWCQL